MTSNKTRLIKQDHLFMRCCKLNCDKQGQRVGQIAMGDENGSCSDFRYAGQRRREKKERAAITKGRSIDQEEDLPLRVE